MEKRRIVLGEVTKEEAGVIEFLIERRVSLEELLLTDLENPIRERVEKEIRVLADECRDRIHSIMEKYGWEMPEGVEWEINYIKKQISYYE